MSRLLIATLLVYWALGFAVEGPSWAAGSSCQVLFANKRYQEAGRCYEGMVRSLESSTQRGALWKLRKDRWLRHGALAFERAAKQAQKIEHKGFLRAQAVRLLMESFRSGSCLATSRCRSHRLLAEELKKKLQKTPLVVVTGTPKARIVIQGYRFQAIELHAFNRRLLPGRYRVEVTLPGGKARTQQVRLLPGRAVTLNVTPYRIKVVVKRVIVAKRVPAWIWVGYVVGASVTLLGAGLVTYGVLEQSRLNNILVDPVANQKLTDVAFEEGFAGAQAVKSVGGVVAGVGVALLAGGVVAHLLNRRRKRWRGTARRARTRRAGTCRVGTQPAVLVRGGWGHGAPCSHLVGWLR